MIEKVYGLICPHCHKKNKVTVRLNEGFNPRENVHCDYCGLKITEMNAAEPPETECVEKDQENDG